MKVIKRAYKLVIGILSVFAGISFSIYSILLKTTDGKSFIDLISYFGSLIFFILGCISVAMVLIDIIKMKKLDETNI